jgi:hypothetical protein
MAVVQEFYCNDCDGYFRARLSVGFNRHILMVCPNCGRQHPREVKNGLIVEGYTRSNNEEIHVPKSSYSKTPVTREMAKAKSILTHPWPRPDDIEGMKAQDEAAEQIRKGVPISASRQIIEASWNDRYTDKYEPTQ